MKYIILLSIMLMACGEEYHEHRGLPGAQGEPGVDGADGQDGQDGENGVDGKDGLDGVSCRVYYDDVKKYHKKSCSVDIVVECGDTSVILYDDMYFRICPKGERDE